MVYKDDLKDRAKDIYKNKIHTKIKDILIQ